ncbi:N-acetyltransferase [Franconibacter daqui]|uniref:N-acetyltransferase n=1 Tax=Franconibacter daqui TaxID=2047724 RepID=UPI0030D32C1A
MSAQVVVRHAEARDTEALRQLNALPEVYHDTLQIPHPSFEMWQARMSQPPAGRRQLVACIDDVVAGHLALTVEQNPRRSHVATFGMSVHPAHRNRGVASALMAEMVNLCDNWLRIERIELTVFADNAPALAVYRKFGFVLEGTGKQFALRNGEYVDAYYMARMKTR